LDTRPLLAYESGMRKVSVALALVVAVAGATGCAVKPSPVQDALLQKQVERYRKRGNAAITGVAYLVRPGGAEVLGNASEVYLTPVTTWAESRVVDVLASNKIPDSDDRAAAVWWVARADSNGRFTFEELVDGEYFVLSPIPYQSGGETLESIAFARVKVGPGETANVKVTRQLDQ
jgi:hypothetical protein